MAVLCLSVDDFVLYFFRSIALLILVLVFLVLVSPPHQVRTAADTASEDYSCGHRRCWTAAASKGLLSLVCVVLVLVAMRFPSWTMMAVICFSVDDFFFFFFRSIALLILVLVSPPHQVYSFRRRIKYISSRRRTKCVRLLTPQAITYTPFCPCLIAGRSCYTHLAVQ